MTVRTNNGSAAKQSLRVASSGWSAQLMKMNGNTKNITVFTNAKTQPSSFCTTESFTTSDSAQPPIAGAKITHTLPVRMLERVAIWYVCNAAVAAHLSSNGRGSIGASGARRRPHRRCPRPAGPLGRQWRRCSPCSSAYLTRTRRRYSPFAAGHSYRARSRTCQEPAAARDSFVKAKAAIEGRGLLERGSWASCDGARAGAHALGVLELLPDHLG